MKRKPPNMHEKLAATLLEYQRLLGDPIDREHAKQMTAKQLCSLFQFDHVTYHVLDGTTHPTNLTPMLIHAHREKTAKIDIPAIAKGKRIRKKQVIHATKMAAKVGNSDTCYMPPGTCSMHPSNKPKRKMQSRGFQGSRKFDGTIRWKTQRKGKGE